VAYIPYPDDPWNEIVPGLFQGGQVTTQYWTDGSMVRVGREFDAVFSFYWGRGDAVTRACGPDVGVTHFHFPIPDGDLTDEELAAVVRYAANVAALVEAGMKVLVRCQAGYNQSGLVVAFALMKLGYDMPGAVELIRAKRSPYALHNKTFLQYIREAAGEAS